MRPSQEDLDFHNAEWSASWLVVEPISGKDENHQTDVSIVPVYTIQTPSLNFCIYIEEFDEQE